MRRSHARPAGVFADSVTRFFFSKYRANGKPIRQRLVRTRLPDQFSRLLTARATMMISPSRSTAFRSARCGAVLHEGGQDDRRNEQEYGKGTPPIEAGADEQKGLRAANEIQVGPAISRAAPRPMLRQASVTTIGGRPRTATMAVTVVARSLAPTEKPSVKLHTLVRLVRLQIGESRPWSTDHGDAPSGKPTPQSCTMTAGPLGFAGACGR